MMSIQREQIDEAVAAGLKYVQLDYPLYPMLLDQQYLDIFAAMDGSTFDSLMDRCIAADRAIIDGLPDDVTRAIHLCRGNWKSRHMVSGSLEPVAERFFTELPYDAFFIEWEDIRREGGYEALRQVPKGPIVYLGIVNTKVPEVESADSLVRKIESATQYIDVSQLAISPQCGFASTMHGNELDEDAQWRKLEEMVKAAETVWGGVPAACDRVTAGRSGSEFSAGGVVVNDRGEAIVIVPTRRAADGSKVLALPKGHPDGDESPEDAALREVREETGVEAEVVGPLGDVRYWYQRGGRRIAKVVSFYLLRYAGGSLDDHDAEVEEARWMPLAEAARPSATRASARWRRGAVADRRTG